MIGNYSYAPVNAFNGVSRVFIDNISSVIADTAGRTGHFYTLADSSRASSGYNYSYNYIGSRPRHIISH